MWERLHSHNFMGETTYNDGHVHRYSGTTSQDPDIPGHVHTMMGRTTYDNGHTHGYSLYTSPAIGVDNGHTHYYQADTTYNDGHMHCLYGYNEIYR